MRKTVSDRFNHNKEVFPRYHKNDMKAFKKTTNTNYFVDYQLPHICGYLQYTKDFYEYRLLVGVWFLALKEPQITKNLYFEDMVYLKHILDTISH